MTDLQNLSLGQLRQALSIKERIESLQTELFALTGAGAAVRSNVSGKRTMSASAKARIAAGQRARWARFRARIGLNKRAETAPKKRRKMNAAWRAKIAAAARARWAKAKAAGKNAL